MSNEPSSGNTPDSSAEATENREEFLVSAVHADPASGSKRLFELVKAIDATAGPTVIRTIESGDAIKAVVLLSTPSQVQSVAARFPDLTIEKNLPLQMF